jgi:ADP-heptose:LPS heptosyltransferase
MAGVRTIAAISEDYPGSLLDVRHRVSDDVHEVTRALSLVETLGYRLPDGDDGRLRVRRPALGRELPVPYRRYVVVHPGASVPARAWDPRRCAELVRALLSQGERVVVTGGATERELVRYVAGPAHAHVQEAAGAFRLAELVEILAGADAVITGNTGPAHLAAAVGTPVVSLYAPTVPAVRWHPWGINFELLGDQAVPCAGCRARQCSVPGQPCLGGVTVTDVLAAIERVRANRGPAAGVPAGAAS